MICNYPLVRVVYSDQPLSAGGTSFTFFYASPRTERVLLKGQTFI